MKLARVALAPFRLPLVAELRTGSGALTARDGFAIRIVDSIGALGLGEATPLVSQGTESLAQCGQALRGRAPSLIGASLDSLEDIAALLEPWTQTPAARCGVELALLDLLARARSTSVAGILSTTSSTMEINALLMSDSPEALASESRLRVNEGFGTLKLKVGARSLEEDVERLRSVRAAASPSVALRIDANGAWSLPQAWRALEVLAEVAAIELCEQPVANLGDLAELSRTSPIPLAADELMARRHLADEVIARRAAHAVVLKPMVLGGVLPALELGRRAHRAGMEIVVTTCLDGAFARAGALHLACALPDPLPACGLATGAALERDLADEPVRIRSGRAILPSSPGLGLELRAELDWSEIR